jgi:hypothetical protein
LRRANAAGKKDYDWSHLAARYFPERVRAKCVTDPSLAVAHKSSMASQARRRRRGQSGSSSDSANATPILIRSRCG